MNEILQKYYEDGLLLKQTHPTLDLTIWNYSSKVQYEQLWDEITLQCRGLVTNSKGEIIARPFKKFFNYEEYLRIDPKMIPNEPFDVFEKMDGSLGILFNYNGEWIIATRGSFVSEQAIKGMEILINNYDTTELLTYNTYLFEIIYPENRIVVEYNNKMLVLLAAFDTKTGNEEPYGNLLWYSEMCGYPIVKKYNGVTDYSKLKLLVENNQEGFVIRFKNGFKMKIKGDEYCRLHRILTNVSNRNIWEYLSTNQSMDEIIDKVPDEFYNWVRNTINDFENQFDDILGQVISDYWDIETTLINEQSKLGEDMIYTDKEYSKRYAEEALKKKYPHLLFSYKKEQLNPINTSKGIWKKLYPSHQKPFKNET
jgi:RNA ligase